MADDASNNPPSFSAFRRWGILFNVVISSVALLALMVMANYMASGYYRRLMLSDSSKAELSPQTRKILQTVTNDVEVTIFFDTHEEEEVYGWVSSLLKQYRNLNPRIKVKTVDPARQPGEAAMVLTTYKMDHLAEKNFVIVDSGGNKQVIHSTQLIDQELEQITPEKLEFRKRTVAFKGELLFSSAIFNVTHPRSMKAYFLWGHGEHDPDKTTTDEGYGKFASILKEENNVEWQKLALRGTNEVPADCQLLIIAGPSKAQFSEQEIAAVENYLAKGGRLFVMLNSMGVGNNSGVEEILAQWGVKAGNDLVVDREFEARGNDLIPAEVNPEHPVTKAMHTEGLQVYLILPRSLDAIPPTTQTADPPKVHALFRTSTNAISRTPLRIGGATEYQDKQGSFPVVVAVERGIRGVTAERGETRIIVVGDSRCFYNLTINSLANYQFAGLAINWLLSQRSVLLEELGPKPVKDYSLTMTPGERRVLSWILLAGMPGAVLFIGGLVWLRRRS